MSGVTTTGSTVLVGLDSMPQSILLWRALLQWLGGVGIVVMAIAILPWLRTGGMQLFHAESSDRSDKPMPRLAAVTAALCVAYLAVSLACVVAYQIAGMTLFDAIAHAMTTLVHRRLRDPRLLVHGLLGRGAVGGRRVHARGRAAVRAVRARRAAATGRSCATGRPGSCC